MIKINTLISWIINCRSIIFTFILGAIFFILFCCVIHRFLSLSNVQDSSNQAVTDLCVPRENRFAILIGNNHYENFNDLEHAENDMIDLRATLLNGGYPSQNIHLLLGPSVTREQVEKTVDKVLLQILELKSQKSPEDDNRFVLVFGFSGHGGEQNLYMIGSKPDDIRTSYPIRRLLLEKLKDKKFEFLSTFVFLDACRENQQHEFHLGDARDYASTNTIVFSACAKGEQSFERDSLGHGVFFHFLIEALRGNDMQIYPNGVELDSLEKYVKREVKAYFTTDNAAPASSENFGKSSSNIPTSQKERDNQTPSLLTEKPDPPFVVEFAKGIPLDRLPEQQRRLIVDLIMLPSVNEGWWAEELPHYLPCFRFALAKHYLSGRESTINFTEANNKLMNPSSLKVQEFLYRSVNCTCNISTSERTLLENMVAFTKMEKHKSEEIKRIIDEYKNDIEEETGKEQKQQLNTITILDRHFPSREAIATHTQAVLVHLYYIFLLREKNSHDSYGKESESSELVEVQKEVQKLYADAIRYYETPPLPFGGRQIKVSFDQDLATYAFSLLCRSDYARFQLLLGKDVSYFKDFQDLVDEVMNVNTDDVQQRNNSNRVILSRPFRVELLTTFAKEFGAMGNPVEKYFNAAEMISRRGGMSESPLYASCLERRAWYLTDNWRLNEAAQDFSKARKIRASISSRDDDPLVALFLNYAEHADATCNRYEGKTPVSFEEITKKADGIKLPQDSFVTFRFQNRIFTRKASSLERAADELLFDNTIKKLESSDIFQTINFYDEAIKTLKQAPPDHSIITTKVCFLEAKRDIAHSLYHRQPNLESNLPTLPNEITNIQCYHAVSAAYAIRDYYAESKPDDKRLDKVREFLNELKNRPRERELYMRDSMDINFFVTDFLLTSESDGLQQSRDMQYWEFLLITYRDKESVAYVDKLCDRGIDFISGIKPKICCGYPKELERLEQMENFFNKMKQSSFVL